MPISDEELAKRRGHYGKVLEDLITQMCSDELGIGAAETVKQLIVMLDNAKGIDSNAISVEGQLDMWMDNLTDNLTNWGNALYLKNNDFRKDIVLEGRQVVVIGAGPSITDQHLAAVKRSGMAVICTNKILNRVLRAGIRPEAVIALDGSTDVLSSFDNWTCNQLVNIKFIIPTIIHPRVPELLNDCGASLYWYNGSVPSEYAPNINYVMKKLTRGFLLTIDTGGNAGIFSTVVAKMCGASDIYLLGLEHCLALNPSWSKEQALGYKIVYDREIGCYAIPPTFQCYINTLVQFIKENPQVRWHNLTKFGWLYTMRDEIPIKYIDIRELVRE